GARDVGDVLLDELVEGVELLVDGDSRALSGFRHALTFRSGRTVRYDTRGARRARCAACCGVPPPGRLRALRLAAGPQSLGARSRPPSSPADFHARAGSVAGSRKRWSCVTESDRYHRSRSTVRAWCG